MTASFFDPDQRDTISPSWPDAWRVAEHILEARK